MVSRPFFSGRTVRGLLYFLTQNLIVKLQDFMHNSACRVIIIFSSRDPVQYNKSEHTTTVLIFSAERVLAGGKVINPCSYC